ncbi:MAG: hypothetical protein IPN23_11010 [Elusimicrobia bacterium]|nr:hypothetical protein [Elusimicrobiota bacterium]
MKEFIARQIFLKLGGVTNTTLVDTNGKVIGGRALWSNTADSFPMRTKRLASVRGICAPKRPTDGLADADIMTSDLVTKAATGETRGTEDPTLERWRG